MVRSSGTLVTVPRACSSPISANICSPARANSNNPTYLLPFSLSTGCAMASHYTPDSIYCQQHLLGFSDTYKSASHPSYPRPVRLRFDTVHVLAIAIRLRSGLGCAAKKETL